MVHQIADIGFSNIRKEFKNNYKKYIPNQYDMEKLNMRMLIER